MFHTYYGTTLPFFTFNTAKLPLFGTLRPSTQPLTSYPICSGLDHLVKSEFGIDCLLDSVSMVSGSNVITRLPLYFIFYAKFNANEWTAVLAIEYPIISGCGSLKTAAAPVKIMSPPS